MVSRVGDATVDVKVQGHEEKKGLPHTQALVIESDGAGALLGHAGRVRERVNGAGKRGGARGR